MGGPTAPPVMEIIVLLYNQAAKKPNQSRLAAPSLEAVFNCELHPLPPPYPMMFFVKKQRQKHFYTQDSALSFKMDIWGPTEDFDV